MNLTGEQAEHIRDFVAALRSGDYLQTHSQLGTVDADNRKRYCCEGVAVERYGEKLGFKVEWRDDDTLFCNGQADYALNDFWYALGLVERMLSPGGTVFAFALPDGLESPTRQKLFSYMELNDDGFTFKQIADLIEWQFLSGDGK